MSVGVVHDCTISGRREDVNRDRKKNLRMRTITGLDHDYIGIGANETMIILVYHYVVLLTRSIPAPNPLECPGIFSRPPLPIPWCSSNSFLPTSARRLFNLEGGAVVAGEGETFIYSCRLNGTPPGVGGAAGVLSEGVGTDLGRSFGAGCGRDVREGEAGGGRSWGTFWSVVVEGGITEISCRELLALARLWLGFRREDVTGIPISRS